MIRMMEIVVAGIRSIVLCTYTELTSRIVLVIAIVV